MGIGFFFFYLVYLWNENARMFHFTQIAFKTTHLGDKTWPLMPNACLIKVVPACCQELVKLWLG